MLISRVFRRKTNTTKTKFILMAKLLLLLASVLFKIKISIEVQSVCLFLDVFLTRLSETIKIYRHTYYNLIKIVQQHTWHGCRTSNLYCKFVSMWLFFLVFHSSVFFLSPPKVHSFKTSSLILMLWYLWISSIWNNCETSRSVVVFISSRYKHLLSLIHAFPPPHFRKFFEKFSVLNQFTQFLLNQMVFVFTFSF